MTYTTVDSVKQPLDEFQKFDADTKLALLWYGYLDLKENLNPAPPNDVEVLGNTLFDKVKALSKEEQLQAQRDVVEGNGTDISKEYGALSSSGALEFWLLLAQGMEAGTIVTVPDDYSLPKQTNSFVEMVKKLDFEERVNFTRNAVTQMGG
ncbi:hypothetical protein BH23CYA1_BH23CYA1_15010 [soil metagenome]|uniref:orange carotenoid protein N-terminal domain-containing protein n=1 Tax=Leptolyngbya sp. BC1307 TaxID=2029589 RepID=UPI000EFBF017|nr:orange carotenoid protein N-terminal domain-containing protein [Leptolyngbya sp. BC1307]